MQSPLVLCIAVCGIATALTGCASMESFKLQKQPATIPITDGVMGRGSNAYSPTDAVKSTITQLLSILGNEALKQPGRSGERRRQIEEIVRHRVSFEQMAKRALGVPWQRLNEVERQEFVSCFVQLLRDTFANKIDQYYDEQIFYLFEQRDGGFAEVKTRLIGPKVDTSLNFRLGSKSGDWLVYDVLIDGASIVGNYQSQFNRIIRDDSYAGLVERMKQRDLLVKVFERTEPAFAVSSAYSPASDSR